MAFRHLLIEHAVSISKELGSLVIKRNGYPYKIPLDDIETVIIDNLRSSLTTRAWEALSKHKILVIICDDHHLPCGINLPLNCYFHRLEVITKQFKMRSKTVKRLWQKIIKQKIQNEILALSLLGHHDLNALKRLYKGVKPGDSKHCEAVAARIYFQEMFGRHFVRRSDNVINATLNYGYSLVRSLITRDICSYGLEPSIGLFHHNMLNSFNLADDLIEPFRSIVDVFVYNYLGYKRNLTTVNYGDLLRILFLNVLIKGRFQSLTNAVHIEVSSYNRCCLRNSSKLILPKLTKLREHD